MNAPQHYPGPGSAFALTILAVFGMAFVIMLFGEKIDLGGVGLGQVVGFGLAAMLATQRIPEPRSERLGLRGITASFLPTLFLLLPTVILTSEFDNILRGMIPPAPLDPEVQELLSLDDTNVWTTIQRVIVLIGLAPVMEEWLFRGVIQQGLVSVMGRIGGVALTAFLFALVHLSLAAPSTSLMAFIPIAFVNGVLFGIVRLASGSLLAAMLLHAGFNAIGVAASYTAESFPIQGFNVPDSHTGIGVLLPCAVMVGVACVNLRATLAETTDVIPLPESTE